MSKPHRHKIEYDETTFAPDRTLSREKLVAIKSAVDWNQQAVNRAEAAKCLSALSAHNNATTGPRHVTAKEALVRAAQRG